MTTAVLACRSAAPGAARLALCVLSMTLAASIAGPALADDWPMANHDPRGSRNQDTETTITAANVGQLAPRWVLDTAGNVYATPLVVAGAVYVPDQGGKMWKVDATTGVELGQPAL